MAHRDVSVPLDQPRQWSARRGAAHTHTHACRRCHSPGDFSSFFFAVGTNRSMNLPSRHRLTSAGKSEAWRGEASGERF